ncbi:hypothetical protein [Methanolobus psychrotolerans]|nr:hypothetical protein [Methanolobus psychrotolerans]
MVVGDQVFVAVGLVSALIFGLVAGVCCLLTMEGASCGGWLF